MRRTHRSAWLIGMTGMLTAAGVVAPLTPAAAQPNGEPEPAAPRFESAEALLDALETANKGIETLSSPIVYRKFYAIQSDEQTRSGTLWFQTQRAESDGKGKPVRRFAVTFDTLIVADRRESIGQHYAFDGQWVVEKTPADKQFTKRQVVPPGEDFDPLRIGEGPFPVPVGQRKADILDRFDAEILPGSDTLSDPSLIALAEYEGLVQLRLAPRPGTAESRDFEEIRIWYEPDGRLLPRIARTVTPIGDESEVVLLKPAVNEPIAASVFSTATPPPSEGWNVSISEYREPVDE